MTRVFLAELFLASSANAQRYEPALVDAYNRVFNPWHGALDALRTIFLAIYVRVNQPFLGGEGDETMVNVVRSVLATIEDQRFATSVNKQRPEIRGAVVSFCGFTRHSSSSIPHRQDSSRCSTD
jgi:hypothetical protein